MRGVLALLLLVATASACEARDVDPASPPVATSMTSTSSTAPSTTTAAQSFDGAVEPVDAGRLSASWREGCPVPVADLRLVSVSHWGFDGTVRRGELVVHVEVGDAIVRAFRALFDAKFPIERMELVDVFGGDDARSMDANNTSAFNCRAATGSSRWSEHAYGRAIDINPVQNPYVTRSGSVQPAAGRAFVDRTPAPGVITPDSVVVQAFADIGWEWGGAWTSSKDYQHFSESGR